MLSMATIRANGLLRETENFDKIMRKTTKNQCNHVQFVY